MMLLHTDGKPLKTHLRALSVLVSLLLLTHHSRGQSQLIGSYQPIVANLGGDIILPCYLVPAINVADLTLEWTRPDMDPRFVHVIRLRHELADKKHKLFKGRTSMFTDELKKGNISLKLSNVQLSDQGKYRCFIPELDRQAFVQLVCVSAAAHPPVVTLSGQSGGVVLQCESAGWYPEPEVLWLDAEGKLLSAGPPETVRGPDDLYTVSSRVTVEKRPSSSFTCRVQHHNTTRTTQTQIHFPDDFFKLQSSSSSHIIGLAVSLAVCILLMLATFFFLWREHIFKTKRKHSDEDQSLNEGERGQLMKPDAVQMEALKGNVENKSKTKNQSEQQLLEEQRRREEAEKEVQTLKEQLQNKKKEVKESELQDLHAEKQRNEKELQSLKGDLENKNRELERAQKDLLASKDNKDRRVETMQKKKDKAEQEVENLKKKLEAQQEKTDTKTKEVEVKEAEVQQLQEEGQRMETSLQTPMEEVELKRPLVSRQKFEEEQLRREEAERKAHILEEKLQKKLEDRDQAELNWTITDEELKKAKSHLDSKDIEILQLKRHTDALLADIQNLKDEKQKSENVQKDLEATRKEFEEKLQEEKRGREEAERKLKNLKKEVESKVLTVPEEKSRIEEAEKDLKLTVPPSASSPLHGLSEGNQQAHEMKGKEAEGLAKEFQTGNCEGSDNSGSVKPPLTPPNAQTSDPGFNIEVDQQHTYIRLRNTSTKDKQLGKWKLDLQVNDNKSITHTFPQSFKLKAGETVTMWVKGHGRNHAPTDLVWRDLKSLSSGDKLQLVLFNQKQEIQHELCVTIP